MKYRSTRVADLLRTELAAILQREIGDPRVRLATVSRVELSSDLSHAKVGISALGTDEEREQCVAALRKAAGFIRRLIGSRMRLRVVPEIVFELDHGAEYSQRISDLLEELRRDDEPSP